MASNDLGSTAADLAFERALFDSARADDLPHARVESAWGRLASELAVVSAALPRGAGPSAAPSAGASPPSATVARGAAAKWLLVGALGGTLATTGVLEWRHHRAAPPVAAPSTAAPALEARLGREPAPERSAAREIEEAPAPHRRHAQPRAGSSVRTSQAAVAPSTLAAEVAALDAARRATADGRHDEALRLLDRYRYDFPAGELAADAEVVAIGALAAKGDAAEAARRAERFLARFPNDPHATDVRRLGRAR